MDSVKHHVLKELAEINAKIEDLKAKAKHMEEARRIEMFISCAVLFVLAVAVVLS